MGDSKVTDIYKKREEMRLEEIKKAVENSSPNSRYSAYTPEYIELIANAVLSYEKEKETISGKEQLEEIIRKTKDQSVNYRKKKECLTAELNNFIQELASKEKEKLLEKAYESLPYLREEGATGERDELLYLVAKRAAASRMGDFVYREGEGYAGKSFSSGRSGNTEKFKALEKGMEDTIKELRNIAKDIISNLPEEGDEQAKEEKAEQRIQAAIVAMLEKKKQGPFSFSDAIKTISAGDVGKALGRIRGHDYTLEEEPERKVYSIFLAEEVNTEEGKEKTDPTIEKAANQIIEILKELCAGEKSEEYMSEIVKAVEQGAEIHEKGQREKGVFSLYRRRLGVVAMKDCSELNTRILFEVKKSGILPILETAAKIVAGEIMQEGGKVSSSADKEEKEELFRRVMDTIAKGRGIDSVESRSSGVPSM